MQTLSLTKKANQKFSFTCSSGTYTITFRTHEGITFASVELNGDVIVNGVRVINNNWLIPYKYLMRGNGNFRVETPKEDYPHYTDFGDDVVLRYYTQEEYEEIVG